MTTFRAGGDQSEKCCHQDGVAYPDPFSKLKDGCYAEKLPST
ncbi:MAG: hypothetical protein ACXW1W_06655 [Methylococcaceae bacterium]